MKTLQISVLTACLLMYALVNVQAAPTTNISTKKMNVSEMKATKDYTINKFIEGVVGGNSKHFAQLLDDDFRQTIAYNGKSLTYNKSQFIKILEMSENIVMNCTTTYTIVEECDDLSIVKVAMKFPTFVRTSYVTMKPNKDDVWKITNVSTVFDTQS